MMSDVLLQSSDSKAIKLLFDTDRIDSCMRDIHTKKAVRADRFGNNVFRYSRLIRTLQHRILRKNCQSNQIGNCQKYWFMGQELNCCILFIFRYQESAYNGRPGIPLHHQKNDRNYRDIINIQVRQKDLPKECQKIFITPYQERGKHDEQHPPNNKTDRKAAERTPLPRMRNRRPDPEKRSYQIYGKERIPGTIIPGRVIRPKNQNFPAIQSNSQRLKGYAVIIISLDNQKAGSHKLGNTRICTE